MPLPAPVIRRKFTSAPKGIVYGPPGAGKTTFGATADKAIILDCENGANHVDCDRTPYLSTWIEIKLWLDALADQEHDFNTVVVDSIDWLLRRLEEHVAGVDGSPQGMQQTLNRAHGGYGNGKLVMRNYVYQYLLPTFDRIVMRGVAVLLLAHAVRRTITTIEGIEIEKSMPEIHPDMANTIIEWSDFIGAIRVTPGGRELVLNETPQLVAKNRYGIKDSVPLTWSDFVAAITSSQKKGD